MACGGSPQDTRREARERYSRLLCIRLRRLGISDFAETLEKLLDSAVRHNAAARWIRTNKIGAGLDGAKQEATLPDVAAPTADGLDHT